MKGYGPVAFRDFSEPEVSVRELMLLLALQRAGKLIVNGTHQRIHCESGAVYIVPAPLYHWDDREVLTPRKIRSLLSELAA